MNSLKLFTTGQQFVSGVDGLVPAQNLLQSSVDRVAAANLAFTSQPLADSRGRSVDQAGKYL